MLIRKYENVEKMSFFTYICDINEVAMMSGTSSVILNVFIMSATRTRELKRMAEDGSATERSGVI